MACSAEVLLVAVAAGAAASVVGLRAALGVDGLRRAWNDRGKG